MSDAESGTTTAIKQKTRLKHPKQYRVIMLNDDYTPMEFVVSVLESIFRMTPAEATQVMLRVHRSGQAVCGIFGREIAEAKVDMVHARAKASGYPLKCSVEEA